jgi:hypothetical protein
MRASMLCFVLSLALAARAQDASDKKGVSDEELRRAMCESTGRRDCGSAGRPSNAAPTHEPPRSGDFDDVPDDAPLTDRVPADRKSYCGQGDADFVETLRSDFMSERLGIANPDGDYKTGLCWLHSMFQRNAVYLTDFHPETGKKPQGAEVYALMRRIAEGRHVARIEGYHDVFDFTSNNTDVLTRVLNEMGNCCAMGNTERRGSTCGGYPFLECLRRIEDGPPSRDPAVQGGKMEELYDIYLLRRRVMYLRVKLASFNAFVSHSALLTEMTREPNDPMQPLDHWRLKLIDPNLPLNSQIVEYKVGQKAPQFLFNGKLEDAEFYPDFENYFGRYDSARGEYCRAAR